MLTGSGEGADRIYSFSEATVAAKDTVNPSYMVFTQTGRYKWSIIAVNEDTTTTEGGKLQSFDVNAATDASLPPQLVYKDQIHLEGNSPVYVDLDAASNNYLVAEYARPQGDDQPG